MVATVNDVMSSALVHLPRDANLVQAARMMRDREIREVIVLDEDAICGIVADRDIAVRVVAEGLNAEATTLAAICSQIPVAVPQDHPAGEALDLMLLKGVRALLVSNGSRVIGLVTLEELAGQGVKDRPSRAAEDCAD